MPKLTIIDKNDESFTDEVESGATLWDACSALGVNLPHSCVAEGQRVLTEEGYFKIEETVGSTILTEEGPSRFKKLLDKGIQETLIISTKMGNTLEVTPDHRIKIFNGVEFQWVEAINLKEGDQIVGVLGDRGMIPASRGYDSGVWTILGHLYGDGYRVINEGRKYIYLQFNQDEQDLRMEYYKILKKIECEYLNLTEEEPDNHGGVNRNHLKLRITIRSKFLESLLPEYQREGKWREMGLTDKIWSQGKIQTRSFMAALWTADGGGVFGRNQFYLTTKWDNLSRDVRQLLRLDGILTTNQVSERRTPFGLSNVNRIYLLGLSGRQEFLKKIGFNLSRKQLLLEQCVFKDVTQREFLDGVLVEKEIYEKVNFGHSYTKIQKVLNKVKRQKTMLTRTIINLISELKAETRIFRLCRLINENSLYFDRVKEVEKGSKKRVYDILDSATESFTVNQLTVHNCGFGAQCATCTVQVLEGHQNLSHIDEEEEKRYKADGLTIADPRDPDGGSNLEKGRIACRMSCACQVYGDVIVRQPPG